MKYAVLLSAVLFGGLAAGCTDDTLSLTVSRFVPFTQPTMAGGGCTADPSNTAGQSSGLLDVAVAAQNGTGYLAAPVVTNNLGMITAGSVTPGQPSDVQRNQIIVEGFVVQLIPDSSDNTVASALSIRQYEVPTAAALTNPGDKVAVPVTLLRPDIAQALNAALPDGPHSQVLTLNVSAFGDHAGLRIVGGASTFPLNLCKNCLIANFGACPLPAGTPQVSNACNLAQDIPANCCTQGGTLLCGLDAPVKTM